MTQDELYEALKDNDDARTAMMAEQIELQRQHAVMIQTMIEMLKAFAPTVEHETEEAFEKRKAEHVAARNTALRDSFAMAIIGGLFANADLSKYTSEEGYEPADVEADYVKTAYKAADAMIAERSK